MKKIKNVRKSVMVGIGIAVVLVLAGVSVYALSSGGDGSRPANDGSAAVTKAEAEEIALEQVSGAAKENITKSEMDRDDGGIDYDIEIVYDGYEYDFEISAADGRILDQSREPADYHDSNDGEVQGTAEEGIYEENHHEDSHNSNDSISKSKAESIALGQVKGADRGDIIKSEKDYDDGRMEYDIEILHGGYEYEFEIDGATGEILSKDVEREEY